jgi:NAD(P)H-hydrate epimerase
LRSGAGYTALYTPKGILPYYLLKSPEALLCPLGEGDRLRFIDKEFEKLLLCDSIAYGMGLGVSQDVAEGAAYLLREYTGKLILDADGLNSLAKYKKEELLPLFENKNCDLLLTPHIKEFSRLSGVDVDLLKKDTLFHVKTFSSVFKTNVLLKSATTLIVGEKGTFLNVSGNSGQAKGGSGDVLSGVLSGLCAAGLSTIDAGVCDSYLVGKAAELASQEKGEYSLTASDLIDYLGKSFVAEYANEHGGDEHENTANKIIIRERG